jgi:thiamine biosynthesis lipoprotein
MRKVEFIMGMPISIDIPKATGARVFDKAFERLKEIDSRFSTYKPDSEVSRLQRGELAEQAVSQELDQVLAACRQAQADTNGYFSVNYSGRLDPSGYVKGWAINEVSKIIQEAGYSTFCIGAGGDIMARSDGSKTWNIGIQDPLDKKQILDMLSISNGAVATSGNYERGPHIINPKTGQPAQKFLSVTVTGPDIITADVLATAIFAAGDTAMINSFDGYSCIAVLPSGERLQVRR